MHTFKKKKSDGQKDDMRFLTLVTGNFHGILHHVINESFLKDLQNEHNLVFLAFFVWLQQYVEVDMVFQINHQFILFLHSQF